MTRFVGFVASGEAYLLGALLIAVASLVPVRNKQRGIRFGLLLALCIGVTLVALSATPTPALFYGLWGAAILAWFGAQQLVLVQKRALWVIHGFLFFISLGGFFLELPHFFTPTLPTVLDAPIYVIGDSISSKPAKSGEEAWPEILRRKHDIESTNLAVHCATLESALAQVEQIKQDNAWILLEIGGNDMLAESPPAKFERNMRRLLETAHGPDRSLVMFELPLLPGGNRYGMAQRRLADEFDVTLIPKRYLASILSQESATVDGLHLTQQGQEAMSELVWGLIRPVVTE